MTDTPGTSPTRYRTKRLLVEYKYPPDKQPAAITTVFEQMEMMAPRFAEENRQVGADA
ncbi:type I restriction enzyme endonuclease domain-containing protein [Gordonia rhizosphera]|uniref:Type I restriction enzyme HindI endonuclease subunit-like C-terminal domain-containing protein n=1 Tax=Gordonia rhizosphera NBRC 16068 TaxID=1108045 RepID=K6WEZ6_9ACTN|nr:type I restriction enzyme endonuclease domain-containing protein [Gordonia rhizosphera]GAB92296.1 hypothetical protein GORHZ_169_00420 [Gordonia rhizosphera NBRC 16068]